MCGSRLAALLAPSLSMCSPRTLPSPIHPAGVQIRYAHEPHSLCDLSLVRSRMDKLQINIPGRDAAVTDVAGNLL